MPRISHSRLASLNALFKLPQLLRLSASLLTDRRVSLWLKIAAGAGVAYAFSPLDVIPDFTGIGLLDDIVIAILIMQTLIDLAPRSVVDEHCARLGYDRAELDLNVPSLIGDAIELIAGWWAGASAARAALGEDKPRREGATPQDAPQKSAAAKGATAAPRMTVEEPKAEGPREVPASVKRYSAYREDKH